MTSTAPSAARRLVPWIAAYLALWTAAGVLFSTPALTVGLSLPDGPPAGSVLGVVLTGWYVRALFGVAVIALALRFPIKRGNAWRAVPFHVGAGVLFAVAKIAVCAWATRQVEYLPDASFRHLFIGEFPLDVAAYWAVLGGAHGFAHYRELRNREVEAARWAAQAAQLREQLARAQLDALKAQLQPHFLFNTLHSISALIHENPDAADRMVEQLSDFLRRVIENGGAQEVRLRDELALLDGYLAIQRTRYEDRLSTRAAVEPGAMDAWVPNLVLQPLVENAIRHGVERRAGAGCVEIDAAREADSLVIRVRDDGPGPRAGRGGGSGVGLANTRARLERLYGARHALTLEAAPAGGSVVTLRLPFRTAEAP
jgi:signal transduction histidine kinase